MKIATVINNRGRRGGGRVLEVTTLLHVDLRERERERERGRESLSILFTLPRHTDANSAKQRSSHSSSDNKEHSMNSFVTAAR